MRSEKEIIKLYEEYKEHMHRRDDLSLAIPIAQLEWVLEGSQWISVKNNLPINGQKLILCVNDEIVTYGHFEYNSFWWNGADANRYEKITHWMPLPENPKDIQENEYEK